MIRRKTIEIEIKKAYCSGGSASTLKTKNNLSDEKLTIQTRWQYEDFFFFVPRLLNL